MTTPPTDSSNPKDLLGLKKPPLRLLSFFALTKLCRVMALGARKYGPWNWRKAAVRRSVYLEAILRHAAQALEGEDRDIESGMPHEAHIMACAMIIMDAAAVGKLIDDRAGVDVGSSASMTLCFAAHTEK